MLKPRPRQRKPQGKRIAEALRESESRYRSLLDGIPLGVYRSDVRGRILDANAALIQMLGYHDRETLLQVDAVELYDDPAERQRWQTVMQNEGVVQDFETQLRRYDGQVIWVRDRARAVRDSEGRVLYYEGSLEDITERRRVEEALQFSEEKFSKAFRSNPNAITISTLAEGQYIDVNESFLRLSGYRREEVIGHTVHELNIWVHPEDRARMVQRLQEQGSVRNLEFNFRTRFGEVLTGLFSGEIISVWGNPCLLASVHDITEHKRLEAQLVHLANHDPLTNLFNRRRFEEELEHHLAHARRYSAPGALLFMDLDQFKDVNDSLGHLAGDEFLASLARVLQNQLRESDVIARPGGDEFVALLPQSDAQRAREVAERVLKTVEHHTVVLHGRPVAVTASIGIVLFPQHGHTTGELLSRADLALYQAKASGRNRSCVWAPDRDGQAQVESRLAWQHRIREALEKDGLVLHAQPILHLARNEVSQYELLLRMTGEKGESIAPGAFLDAAERFGLANAIDRWVVRQALDLLAQRSRTGHAVCVEINLSGKALTDGDMLQYLEQALTEASVNPADLIVEVTETAAIADIAQAEKFAGRLKKLGCRFGLDDFGVGFSSFHYLKHLPVDFLKIDGNFIRELLHNPVDQQLVKAMVAVARSLGKMTIAEHVGDAETLRLLREMGVDYAQGFHIGRPRPLREIFLE